MTEIQPASTTCFERLDAQIDAYQVLAIIYTAIKLAVPDVMGREPWTADQLAAETGCGVANLYRLLRGLSAIGVCDESSDGQVGVFKLTLVGQELRTGSPSPLREKVLLAVEQYGPAWQRLNHCLTSKGAAFEQAFGMPVWQHRREHPELNEIFNTWLAKETAASAASLVQAINFSGAAYVADIGGGSGGLLAAILKEHPRLAGILFDQPQVIEQVGPILEAAGISNMVSVVGGDFFSEIPVRAELYLLKSVIHDWDDERARCILRNCRAAMRAGEQLLVIERVLPERAAEDERTIMLDLHMMAVTGGHERSLPGLRALVQSGGFAIRSVRHASTGYSLITATPL